MPDTRSETAAAFKQIAAQIKSLDDLMNRTFVHADAEIQRRFEATKHLWRLTPAMAGVEASRLADEIQAECDDAAADSQKDAA